MSGDGGGILARRASLAEPEHGVPVAVPIDEFPGLKPWQREARKCWYQAGGCGVVEAVTGSGKTMLAAALIYDEIMAGRRSLVVVPTIVLMYQWVAKLQELIPDIWIGALGDRHSRVYSERHVIVGVVNSVAHKSAELGFIDTVIADECHNYGADSRKQALLSHATHRLGLTATFERMDDGVDEVLRPYFGDTVFTCGFDTAFNDGLLAPARVALVAVEFTDGERREYEQCREATSNARRVLIGRFEAPARPFGSFIKAVAIMAKDPHHPGAKQARIYLKQRNRTRQLLATSSAKVNFVVRLSSLFRQSRGALLFCERIAAANEAAEILGHCGLRVSTFHSGLDRYQKQQALAALANGRLHVLCTAKALDEGVDVPDTDLGLVAACTQQRRQMIQRLGRVLRVKSDGRSARFVITYVKGAREEDPMEGAHDSFLNDIDTVIGEHRYFEAQQVDDVMEFLQPGHRRVSTISARRTRIATPTVIDREQPSADTANPDKHHGPRPARLLRGHYDVVVNCLSLAGTSKPPLDQIVLYSTLVANAAIEQAGNGDGPSIAQLPRCADLMDRLGEDDLKAIGVICEALIDNGSRYRVLNVWLTLGKSVRQRLKAPRT